MTDPNDTNPPPLSAIAFAATRRGFLGGVGASAFALGALSAAPGFAAAAPKRGGKASFAINDGAQTDSYDPATWESSYTMVAFGGTLCNALTEISVDGKAAPDLAESYAHSDDLATWTFKLRQGLKFHDGRPVTPADVIASFRHHMGPKSTSAAKAIVDTIADIKAEGTDAVVFTLTGGNADFAWLVSDIHLAIFPAKADGSLDWAPGIATGPYKIDDFKPGETTRYSRNPTYHKPGQPYFDKVEIVNIIDATARTNALMTEEIDYMVDADMKTLPLLSRNKSVAISKFAGLRHFTFSMNTEVAPFNDPNVRMALKYAIDRETIVKKAFLGNAIAANDDPLAHQIAFAIDPMPKHVYDPQTAKEWLKKSNLDSVKVDLHVSETAFPNAIDAALLFKDSAAAAGIEITIVREPDDGYWDNVWMVKDFVAVDWLGKPTADSLFTTVYASNGPWNDTHWKNATFDDMLIAARKETDHDKRAKIYADMQQILHDDGGALVISFAYFIDALSTKIGHGTIGNMLQCDNFRMTERWWRI